MPEAKGSAPAAEKATEAPVKSARETLEDDLVGTPEPTEKAPVEPSGESTDEVDSIVAGIEPGEEPEETAGAPEEVDEVDEILREAPKTEEDKSRVQLRIDKLTAEKKALEEEVAALKAQREAPKDGKKTYTPEQLRTALKKAMDEGDSDLVWDIMQYQRQQDKEDLIKMYNDEKKKGSEVVERVKTEWLEIKAQHAKYVDPKMPELFPGSREALNLDREDSLLYRVADRLYWDKEKGQYYQSQPGGQKLAVSDALAQILARYMTKGGGKTKKIERQLLKEKRKKTIVGEGSMETEEKPSKPVSDGAILEEVLNERRKYLNERGR